MQALVNGSSEFSLTVFIVATKRDDGVWQNHSLVKLRCHAELRRRAARASAALPAITGWNREILRRCVLERSTPWGTVSPPDVAVPGMLTSWRPSWMNQHYPEADAPGHHASFLHLFERYTATSKDSLRIERSRFTDYDGNENVPLFRWHGAPVELLFVDYGRTLAANDASYKALLPSLIPGRTLIVLQDWGTHKQVPWQWCNRMDQFVAHKGDALEMVHELENGSTATFLFCGDTSSRQTASSKPIP